MTHKISHPIPSKSGRLTEAFLSVCNENPTTETDSFFLRFLPFMNTSKKAVPKQPSSLSVLAEAACSLELYFITIKSTNL